MSKITVAVTGAKGYLGHALVKELSKKDVNIKLSLHKNTDDFDKYNCEKFFGDICDQKHLEQVFENVDTVYHVAGIVDITGERDDLVWKVNFDGTANVVAACKKCNVKNLVYVSSVDCVPVSDDMEIITEPDFFGTGDITGAYGKSKAAATQYVREANSDTLKTCCVHPSCCIGPDDIYGTNSVCTMIRLYLRGFFPVTLNFGGYNFVDVRDVARGMIAAAEKGRGGESYFLCGDKLSVADFIATLAHIEGKKPPEIALSKKMLLHLCPYIEEFFKLAKIPPVLTKFSINKICENCNFSYQKAADELGYRPMTAVDSLRDTVEWIKEQKEKEKEEEKFKKLADTIVSEAKKLSR